MKAKSLICNHEVTKPKMIIEGVRNKQGMFQGRTKMALCCAVCGSRLPETDENLAKQHKAVA